MSRDGTRPILVVDDDEDILDLVKTVLNDEGYAVSTAPHGAAALEMVRTERPTLILLDMRMPVMDGWTFARMYRQQPGADAPIVVVTAAENASKWAGEIGAEGYLAKPFELDQLIGTVGRFVAPQP